MKIVFWTAAALVGYAYLAYPLWLFMRSRTGPRSWHRAEIRPSVSIILAVHNGVARIQEQINHLLATEYQGEFEVIVVSDGSCDGTNSVLKAVSNRRFRPFFCVEHRGKAAALNVGIRNARGEILVFVDNRPRLERCALIQLVCNFADPTVGCAAGELVLRHHDHDPATAAVGNIYWRHEQWLRMCESAIDSPCGVYGGFYAVRRSLVAELPEGLILDDMYQPLQIVRRGYRSVLDTSARVFDVWPRTSKGEFTRKVRTLAGNFQLLQFAPWLLSSDNRLRFQLVSHKLLRLVIPFLLIACFVACITLRQSSFYLVLLLAQAAGYALAVFGLVADLPGLRRVTGAASAFCVLNAAVIVALWKFFFVRGPLWRIWVPSEQTATAGMTEVPKTIAEGWVD